MSFVLCWNLGPHYLSIASLLYLVVGAVLSLLVAGAYGYAMQVACLYVQIIVLLPRSGAEPTDLTLEGAMAWQGLGMALMVTMQVVARTVTRGVFVRRKSQPYCDSQKETDS